MEARLPRVALLVAVLIVSMGAKAKTPNFIVETSNPKLAQQFAQVAETARRDMAVLWLGKAMPNWSQPCVITVNVGPQLGAGGATSFVFENGEVFGWRMTIQGSAERIVDSVLPHEVTHMILATHFRQPLPRWADEGAATSVEVVSERTKQRNHLVQFLRTGRGIAFDRMFAMTDYPADYMPLYAQGYSLVEFLLQKGGHRGYIRFLEDGLKNDDWSGAIQRHYGIAGAGNLQNDWLAWVRQGSPVLAPRPEQPNAVSGGQMLADNRRPRPEPNLIHRISKDDSPAYAPGSTIAPRATEITPTAQTVAAVELPASGWRAVGTSSAQASTPSVYGPEPTRSQLSRPQPVQQLQTSASSQPARWF